MELQDILSGAKLNERFKSGDSLESKLRSGFIRNCVKIKNFNLFL